MLNNARSCVGIRSSQMLMSPHADLGGARRVNPDIAQQRAVDAVRTNSPVALTPAMKPLLSGIAALPELKAAGFDEDQLAGYVLRTNEDGYYYSRGEAPFAVLLSGNLASHLGVEEMPLYYTITGSGKVDFGGRGVAREATDLSRGMRKKNPIAEVLFDGGKSFCMVDKDGFLTVSAVYGDQDLFIQGDVLAKGGMRIITKNIDGSAVEKRVLDVVDQTCKAFIDLGTLGRSRMEGPDMCPVDVGVVMDRMDSIGLQAEADLGIELFPLTTSGPAEKGYFSHNEWRVTSYSVMESLAALFEHHHILYDFGIDPSADRPMLIQGFGEVGSNVARLIKEVDRYSRSKFMVSGFSDESAAFFNREGFDIDLLYSLAAEREDRIGGKMGSDKVALLTKSAYYSRLEPYRLADADALLSCPSLILLLAGPGYVIKSISDVADLRTKIVAPAANNPLGTRQSSKQDIRAVERAMADRKIIYILDWLANFGGIDTSKEEVVHRITAGGLENLTDPGERKWLREHVMEGDISDVAWANMFWALKLWKEDHYEVPMSEIMERRVDEILTEKKYILTNWPREDNLAGNLMRLDTATMIAKMSVMNRDLSGNTVEFRNLLRDSSAPEMKRRVAAYVLGKSARDENIIPLLNILENPEESDIMFRQAAVGLVYTLVNKKHQGPYLVAINRITAQWQKMKSGGVEISYPRKVSMQWLLSMLDLPL